MADWRAKNPEVWRAHNKKTKLKRYGLTLAEFANLSKRQDGKCAICANVPKTLYVDHCHVSNKVRGLLCSPCNSGLGYFHDNPGKLLRAAFYVSVQRA